MLTGFQKACVLGVVAGFTFAALVAPAIAGIAVILALTVPFACITTHRLVSLVLALVRRPGGAGAPLPVPDPADPALPGYVVLIPLYREADRLPGLVEDMLRLAYPAERLDIVLIVEQSDLETQAAIARTRLAGHMRMCVVPEGRPRTKPRALNYALQGARGDFVVIYDAEDTPEPDQLLKAVATFARRGPHTACLQARLNVDNRRESWFSRQFAIEYSVLFGALLPALALLKLPMPLGGTSNHFRRRVLEDVGGWDAFNVTEDADLGIRLSRAGFAVDMLDSTTWEEAPASYKVWRGQRRRWLKGWMQTLIVHSRRPLRLVWELGIWKTAGFAILMGGILFSALVHPWVYVGLALDIAGISLMPSPFDRETAQWLWAAAFANLLAGYASAIMLGAVVVWRLGWRDLLASVATMPVYWLLVSLAAYRAAIELLHLPHYWEKTMHRARPGRGRPA